MRVASFSFGSDRCSLFANCPCNNTSATQAAGASAARCETRLLTPRVFDGAEREHVVGQRLQVAMSEYGDGGGV